MYFYGVFFFIRLGKWEMELGEQRKKGRENKMMLGRDEGTKIKDYRKANNKNRRKQKHTNTYDPERCVRGSVRCAVLYPAPQLKLTR